MNPGRRRRAVALAIVATVLASCGGGERVGDGADGAADGEAAASAGPDAAAMTVLDDDATHRAVGDGAERPAREVPVATVGDTVATDEVGLVQLDYLDGSLTRVGPRSTFTLGALDNVAEALQVRVELDVGRTWHRVADLPAGAGYEVATQVATAAVRGTSFAVVCEVADVCTFTAVVGEVDVLVDGVVAVTLGPGDRVVVDEDGVAEQDRLDEAGLRADPWIDGNLDRDGDEQEPTGPAGPPQGVEAVVAGARGFDPPWEPEPVRPNGVQGWVLSVEYFPHFGTTTSASEQAFEDATARGHLATANRTWTIPGPDDGASADDADAEIWVAQFAIPEQAGEEVARLTDFSLQRDGATGFDPGLDGVTGVRWQFSQQDCEFPDGADPVCTDTPPWTVWRLLFSADTFVVSVHVEWPEGQDEGPSQAIEVVEDLRRLLDA